MDLVVSNGVLHHTYDTKKAFLSVARLVKPGGHLLVGLYNHIGRLRTDFRRILVRTFGERVLVLDPQLRKNLSPEKRRAWIRDQYFHPQERKHSISELIGWFDEAGFSFVSSIPKVVGEFGSDEDLFKPQSPAKKSSEIENIEEDRRRKYTTFIPAKSHDYQNVGDTHLPIIIASGLLDSPTKVPWWQNYTLRMSA